MIDARERQELQGLVAALKLQKVFTDLQYLVDRLEEFAACYGDKAANAPAGFPNRVTVSEFIADYSSNALRVKAILQAAAFKCSANMLAMMWMVELGARLSTLDVSFHSRTDFLLTVSLTLPSSGATVEFESAEIWDLAVLRFVGIAKADSRPVLEGFYPMRVP
jgi:hypothetical protein